MLIAHKVTIVINIERMDAADAAICYSYKKSHNFVTSFVVFVHVHCNISNAIAV